VKQVAWMSIKSWNKPYPLAYWRKLLIGFFRSFKMYNGNFLKYKITIGAANDSIFTQK